MNMRGNHIQCNLFEIKAFAPFGSMEQIDVMSFALREERHHRVDSIKKGGLPLFWKYAEAIRLTNSWLLLQLHEQMESRIQCILWLFEGIYLIRNFCFKAPSLCFPEGNSYFWLPEYKVAWPILAIDRIGRFPRLRRKNTFDNVSIDLHRISDVELTVYFSWGGDQGESAWWLAYRIIRKDSIDRVKLYSRWTRGKKAIGGQCLMRNTQDSSNEQGCCCYDISAHDFFSYLQPALRPWIACWCFRTESA